MPPWVQAQRNGRGIENLFGVACSAALEKAYETVNPFVFLCVLCVSVVNIISEIVVIPDGA
jgi:hypothetical protein